MNIQIIILIPIICVNAKQMIYISDAQLQKIGPRLYTQELLTNEFKSPKELAYDSSSRNLYFMYMDDIIQNSGRAYVNVVTKRAMKISGIERNKATAVDSETGDVYFGSDDGLYKLDALTNVATRIGLYGMNIHKIVIRNNAMYIINAENHVIYKIFNQGVSAVRVNNIDKVMEFDVDNQKSIHFVTMSGVYCQYEGFEVIKNKDLNVVYHFLVEGERTYGITENGIYQIYCWNGTANRVVNMNYFPRSFVFGDYGDIYYSIDDNIYRLKPVTSYVIYRIHKNT